jgi:hypothetical protein
MNVRKFLSVACLLSILLVSACKSKGSEFIGKWVVNDPQPDSKPLEIARNGESYLVTAADGTKLPAELDKDSGVLKAANGIMTLTYVKNSDTLLAAGLFGMTQEFKRAK